MYHEYLIVSNSPNFPLNYSLIIRTNAKSSVISKLWPECSRHSPYIPNLFEIFIAFNTPLKPALKQGGPQQLVNSALRELPECAASIDRIVDTAALLSLPVSTMIHFVYRKKRWIPLDYVDFLVLLTIPPTHKFVKFGVPHEKESNKDTKW